jgi:hypothetical protein
MRSMIHRLLPVLAVSALAAGTVTAVTLADAGPSSSGPAATAPAPAPSVATTDGPSAAALLAGGSAPVPYAETGLGASLPGLLDGVHHVDPSQAWRIAVPGDARPGWIFAGDTTIAVVIPRTQVGPDGEEIAGAASVFGATAETATTTGFAVSQSAGGQEPRKILFLPPGAPAPTIVAEGANRQAAGGEPVPHAGRVYVAEPEEGQEVLVPSFPEQIRRLPSDPS